MCNACGFYCCGSDEFEKCGCDHCPCQACWPDDEDEHDDGDDNYYECCNAKNPCDCKGAAWEQVDQKGEQQKA